MGIADVLSELWRKKWFLTISVVVASLLAILISYRLTPVYRSSALLLIEPKDANVVSIDQVYDASYEGMRNGYLYTQFLIVKSRSLLSSVATKLELTTNPEFDPRQQQPPMIDIRGWISSGVGALGLLPPSASSENQDEKVILESVVNQLERKVQVLPVRGSMLAKIEVDTLNPRLGPLIANAVARAYIENQLESRLEMTETANAWMTRRMSGLREQISEAEQKLQAYSEREALVDLNGVTTVSEAELFRATEKLSDARKALTRAEGLYQQVRGIPRSDWQRLAETPAVLANESVNELKRVEGTSLTKVRALAERYGPKHPKMIAARTELNTATENFREKVLQVVAGLERNYELAQAELLAQEEIFSRNKNEIRDINRKKYKLRELTLDVNTSRAVYDTFLARVKETSATADIDNVSAWLVDEAVVPRAPVKPEKKKIVMLTAVLTFLSGVALVLLRALWGGVFRNAGQLAEQFPIPVIGSVPQAKVGKSKGVARSYATGADAIFNEAIRSIRTGLTLADKPSKVILVTSSVPGEGKSTVCANLAAAFGQLGKTVLVDADMRRPSISSNFEYKRGSAGLADILTGSVDYRDCLKNEEGFDVVTAGTATSIPLELIALPKFGQFIERLEEDYEYVLIDSPPLAAVSDAQLISQWAGSVAYIVKAQSTTAGKLKANLSQLPVERMGDVSLVLNQVRPDAGYGYDPYAAKYYLR